MIWRFIKMSEVWGAVIGSLGFTALVIAPFIVNKIIKFKLEIAKINAETTVRTEEIRSRNQFEFEKYLKQEEIEKNKYNSMSDEDISGNSNRNRVRV